MRSQKVLFAVVADEMLHASIHLGRDGLLDESMGLEGVARLVAIDCILGTLQLFALEQTEGIGTQETGSTTFSGSTTYRCAKGDGAIVDKLGWIEGVAFGLLPA